MALHRLTLAGALGIVLGCGPGGEASDGDTETETETDGSTSDGSASASMTQGSASMTQGSASMTQGSATADSDSPDTSASATATATATEDDGGTTTSDTSDGSDGACPPGGQGCPCDIGSSCIDGLECVDGVCVEPVQCDEPEGEPNDDEATAVVLDAVTCGADAMQIEAALFGADTDWYIFEVMGAAFCFTNPTATVTVEDLDVEVCIFAVCPEDGQPNANCGFMSGQVETESPDGRLGCCGEGSAVLESAACDFAQTPPSTIEVSVTGDTDRACVGYELEWSH